MPLDPQIRERYSRQILFPDIGEQGQQRLCASSAVLVGCGALGAASANLLVRAGIGRLRIIDRDFVEDSNLQRQTLFEQADARQALPKAVAAERRLRSINSLVQVEGIVADLTPENIQTCLSGFDLLLDGTDNFETRLLLNDFAVAHNRPWIYAAVVAAYGVTMAIRPARTACLACLIDSAPDGQPGTAAAEATCDTIGVLGPAAGVISSLQISSALRVLTGNSAAIEGELISCDVWSGRFQKIRPQRNPHCRACVRGDFSFLLGRAQPHVTLCGRDSVQIHERRRQLNLAELGGRLAAVGGQVRHNEYLLRLRLPPYEMTVFADGRAVIKGTRDPAVARSLYARYIGA